MLLYKWLDTRKKNLNYLFYDTWCIIPYSQYIEKFLVDLMALPSNFVRNYSPTQIEQVC